MIKLIIYDLDGTLIDSRLDIAEAVNWTLQEIGLKELPVEQISNFVGNGVTHLMRQALQEALDPDKTIEEANEAPWALGRSIKLFRRRYGDRLLKHTALYPSVRKVLEFFTDRKQAVITNKPEEFSMRILKGLHIDSYFIQILGGDQGFPKKPSPETVLELLRATEIPNQEAVLVGDSATDIETGKNAGIHTIAVTYGFGRRPDIEQSDPELILDDLEELTRCPLLRT